MPYQAHGLTNQGYEAKPTCTPVLSVAGAYAAGDYMGTSAKCMTFENCASIPGGAGWVLGASIVDGEKQSAAMELWLFKDEITPPADNAAWTITDAVLAESFLCVVPLSTYYASAVNSVAQGVPDCYARYVADEQRRLYGVLVARAATTQVSLAVKISLSLSQD